VSEHLASVAWLRSGAPFTGGEYSREHRWRFDGGLEVVAAASPWIVPEARTNPAGVDPEEVFVASLARCHMLWFRGGAQSTLGPAQLPESTDAPWCSEHPAVVL